jgi:hypothetical protein
MKAKSKPLAQKKPADYGVDVAPRLKTLKVSEPPVRSAGIKVADVDALVAKLKEMGVACMKTLVWVEHDNAPGQGRDACCRHRGIAAGRSPPAGRGFGLRGRRRSKPRRSPAWARSTSPTTRPMPMRSRKMSRR